jgi:hypothetical protein
MIISEVGTLPATHGGHLGSQLPYPPLMHVASVIRLRFQQQIIGDRDPYLRGHKPSTLPGLTRASQLAFGDLQTFCRFFQTGPGSSPASVSQVRLLSITYRDDPASWISTAAYAYEAFELLVQRWDHMRIHTLRIHFPHWQCIKTMTTPGLWSLLKLRRRIPFLDIRAARGSIASPLRATLRGILTARPAGNSMRLMLSSSFLSHHFGPVLARRSRADMKLPAIIYLDRAIQQQQDRMMREETRTKQRAAARRRRLRYPLSQKRCRNGGKQHPAGSRMVQGDIL